MHHDTQERNQKGQSIVIVAVAMIVLLIFGAFAVDLSFAYFQRRSMQNAADAAALAGARALGVYQSDPTAATMTNNDLYLILQDYAARNKAKQIEAFYTAPGGVQMGQITPGSGSEVPRSGVTGVAVNVSTDFSTFFARVLGYDILPARAEAGAAYGAATSAKNSSPLALQEDEVNVGDTITLCDPNLASGNADAGWLALNCRYPSHGSFCEPTNPDLLDWTLGGYGGVTRAPGKISGSPSHDFWSNVGHLQVNDVLVLPVFDKVYHYTHYAKCHPNYVAQHGAYDCWAQEDYGEVIPVYTEDPAFETFFYYNITSFAALNVTQVADECIAGEFIPYSVEGDWVNPTNDGVIVVKLTDNKGVPTSTIPTRTPTPAPHCDASLSLVFTPQDNEGCGPYVFTLTVENTGEQGSASDVVVQISPTKGQEWIQAVSPEVWNIGELPAGAIVTQEVIVTPKEDWPYAAPRGAEVGAEIKLEAQVINEGCRPDHNEGKRDTCTAIKGDDCEPATSTPTPTATYTPTPTNSPTPTATATATPRTAGDIQGQVVACVPTVVQSSKLVCERVPVDVVHVVDTSYSMRWGFGGRNDAGPPIKMDAAKSSLLIFNGMLQPNATNRLAGDQVGLVSFDGTSSRTRSELTNSVSTVNTAVNSLGPGGWTPLVMGIERGTSVLLSSRHAITHTPIIVLASDGLANVRRDAIRHPKSPSDPAPLPGTYAYDCRSYYGSGDSYADCLENPGYSGYPGNHPVMYDPESSAQAIQAANTAKAAGVEIFTIAIGNDFDDSVLQAIASPDNNGLRHFVAANSSELAAIYEGIIGTLSHLEHEENCRAELHEAVGAQVILTGANYSATTTTDDEGRFSFIDVPEGTYTFQASVVIEGVTYDVLTDQPCGNAITQQLVVQRGQTYMPMLNLARSDPPCQVVPKLFVEFTDGTPAKSPGANQPVRIKVKVEDQFYHAVEDASVNLLAPNFRPLDEYGMGYYGWEGGSYGAYDICWTVEANKISYEGNTDTAITDEDGSAPAQPTPLPTFPPTSTPAASATPTATPVSTSTPTPTATATVELWVTDWSGTLGYDNAICEYPAQWITITGTVTIQPANAKARLQTTWYVVNPQGTTRCPPEVPNCNETQYSSQDIQGNTTFTIRAWWPGIQANDSVVEIHYGANVLDKNGNPLHSGIGRDIYWYPWYCPPPGPTATPTATPLPTPTPNWIGHHQIDFLDSTYNGTNTTFTYRVTSGGSPSISHWVLGGCFSASDIVSASEMYEYVTSDPNTGARGAKFDTGYNDGESRIVSITLRGEFAEQGQLFGVSVKSGQQSFTGSVLGPACKNPTPTSTTTRTATPTATPALTPFAIKINAGSGSWADPNGNAWSADQGYSGSSSVKNPGTTDGIAGTNMDYMLQRYRYGSDFTYTFGSIPNGNYVVKLWFAESSYTASNKRKFNVVMNGTTALSNLDVYAQVGHDTVLLRTFTVPVTDNTLTIQFKAVKNSAMISGIEIDGG